MSVWDWVRDFRHNAEARGDAERLRMLSLYDNAIDCHKTDPHKGLEWLAQARATAERLGERWWVLHLDHWRLQYLLHDLLEARAALELAVRATLEARKPEYAALPQRVCLHEDLIYAYIFTDPAGHGELVGGALEYMRGEVGDDLECRYCVQNCATEWRLRCGRLDEAEGSARRALQMADADRNRYTAEHHAVAAYADLCEIAFGREDWGALAGHVEAGEELVRRRENPRKLAEFLMWRALLARRAGDEEAAKRLMRQAVARTARVRSLPFFGYYDALCAYHELGGDLRNALRVRAHELDTIAGKGRLYHECRTRVARCRLLARMGLPLGDDLTAAREAANRLRDPAPHLEALARIDAGEAME